jgi:hypothetical protein
MNPHLSKTIAHLLSTQPSIMKFALPIDTSFITPTSLDAFASDILSIACEEGAAYLWRVDNALRVFGRTSNAKFDGKTLVSLKSKNRAQFLGLYTADARGADILSDMRFEVKTLQNQDSSISLTF